MVHYFFFFFKHSLPFQIFDSPSFCCAGLVVGRGVVGGGGGGGGGCVGA